MRKLAMAFRAAAIAAALLACAGAQAQVYKWVDAKGVTHYGEKPPEGGQSREVQLRSTSPAGGGAPPAASATVQEQERAFRQRQTAREESEARQARERARQEEQCGRARAALADMRASGRMFERNEKGERVFLSDKAREDTIAARQTEYNQYCR